MEFQWQGDFIGVVTQRPVVAVQRERLQST
jgi:hypothetical protein